MTSLTNATKQIVSGAIIICTLSCTRGYSSPEVTPTNYVEMFHALNLQFDVPYRYIEVINSQPTGNTGTIKFSLADTSMVETYNLNTTKDHFRLDSLQPYSAKFESLGRNRYPIDRSLFINNARDNISFVNGSSIVSFQAISSGTFYLHQYRLFK